MSRAYTLRDVDKGYASLRARLPGGALLTVGVHADDGQAPADGDASVTIADVAIWNEFGTYRAPPRPFIRLYVDTQESRILGMIGAATRQVMQGKMTKEVALDRLGLKMVGEIQRAITVGYFGAYPENAPATIRKKGSETPLVDTGQLRSAIRHRVVFSK